MVKTIVNALPPPTPKDVSQHNYWRGGQWTHPKGCVEMCVLCTDHCVCIYTAGGVSGPTPQSMCIHCWGPVDPHPPKNVHRLLGA